MGTIVEQVSVLFTDESVCLDQARIIELERLLGAKTAESVAIRAMEELSSRLAHCERLFQLENWQDLRKCVRSLIAIGDQIGMTSLSQVSAHVVGAIDAGDITATAATFFRLMRIGDRSLSDYWDQYNLSG